MTGSPIAGIMAGMIRGYLLIAVLLSTGLTTTQEHGREIYRRGMLAGSRVGTAAIGADAVPLPSSSFACATCHGIYGEGRRESGVDTPPLNWKRLTSPSFSSVTRRRRDAYTPETLRRAITAGVDPSGAHLYPGMPRYTMPDKDLTELLAYLERLGDDQDTDPGVTATSIRIGAALPLSGPLAPAGQSIRETLEHVFAEASRDGGIYGRSIDLIAEDSLGTAAGLLDATRHLVNDDRVFAMAASLHAGSSADAVRLLESAEVPLIGPVGLSPHENGVPNAYVFYLLPGLYDQARAIVDFIAVRDAPCHPRLAVIYGETNIDRDVVEGLHAQAALHGLEIVAVGARCSECDRRGSFQAARLSDFCRRWRRYRGCCQDPGPEQPRYSLGRLHLHRGKRHSIAAIACSRSRAVCRTDSAPGLLPRCCFLLAYASRAFSKNLSRLSIRSVRCWQCSLAGTPFQRKPSQPRRIGAHAGTPSALRNWRNGTLNVRPKSARRQRWRAVILALDPGSHDFVAVSGWITPKAGR